jgi:hypothetical protein
VIFILTNKLFFKKIILHSVSVYLIKYITVFFIIIFLYIKWMFSIVIVLVIMFFLKGLKKHF